MSIKPLPYAGPTEVPGFVFSALHAGIKKNPQAPDLVLFQTITEKPAALAAVFTVNRVKAAPVILGMGIAKRGKCRAIVVNSGNANACTGKQGLDDAKETAKMLAQELRCSPLDIAVGSTGVIGQHLPMEKIRASLPSLVRTASAHGLTQAARGICTTDTFDKIAGETCQIDGKTITICGVAKGSGMIAPNMATMLGYLMTDANIPPKLLQKILRTACEQTFNAITVDGEMSTNDTVMLLANGASGAAPLKPKGKAFALFQEAVTRVCDVLARQVVRDGEGSTKFVELLVSGVESPKHRKAIGMAIANSSLVKTAIHGADANWGRILSAAGACAANLGLQANFDRASIIIGDVAVLRDGTVQGPLAEEQAQAILRGEEFILRVVLGKNRQTTRIYFSDLTMDYIRINASYRS